MERQLRRWSQQWENSKSADLPALETLRGELIRRYAEITGFDVTNVAWYRAFAYFKLAVICQGVAARAADGAMPGSGFEDAQAIVEPLVRAGQHALTAPL
jgi:aminoglycoside phosphotransferase (APT) family kinase protein